MQADLHCVVCDGLATGPRLGEGHIGNRFGDVRGDGEWQVTLDGVRCEADVNEAMSGDHGWVHRMPRVDGHRISCPRAGLDGSRHVLAERVVGHVRIVRTGNAPSTCTDPDGGIQCG